MLTYPDRQKFEQIRARWETIRSGEDEAAAMVGWREKSTAHHPVSGELQENGGSKFRRKLSYGFSFISNPLSQRKTTQGRHQANVPSLAVTEPSATDVTTKTLVCEALSPPELPSTPPKRSDDACEQPATVPLTRALPMSADADVTPRPLPRSRTLSFIPLPVKAELNSFAADVEGAVRSHSLAAMPRPEPKSVPTKIPTPSPPSPERCRASPRQHIHQHVSYRASQQIKHIATAHALAAANNGSPVKHAYQVRSRTTPNLVKSSNAPQPARFMAPRRPGPKRPTVSPTAEKLVLQENIPIDRCVTQRRSQIQERTLKRESLAVPGTLNNRRSFGSGPLLAQGREPSFATPPTARKRMSSQFAQQTPVTVKRLQPEEQTKTLSPASPPVSRVTAVQSSHMGPPMSAPETDDFVQPVLPQSHTERDMQRKTLGTPNGLGGVWRSSRALAATTHEVSKLPRSYTYHNFGTQREAAPPVPRIPEQYRSVSLSNLVHPVHVDHKSTNQSRQSHIISDSNPCESISEETDEETMTSYRPGLGLIESFGSSGSTVSLTAFPSVPETAPDTTGSTSSALPKRPWIVSDKGGLDVANTEINQVEDYMPPLYWAGRFQSRYDKWRTDVMAAALNPDLQTPGPLGECKPDQDKLAACYILGQLRDLCTSDQAADSLWVCCGCCVSASCFTNRTQVFEYKYRKDHRLLCIPADLPPMPVRKQDDTTTAAGAGAFGRAMRKLTPRKASLVNLMKGKGWNKSDEARSGDAFEHNQETSSDCS
jgi:hypothetical protein